MPCRITPAPWVLLAHFFLVAVLAVHRIVKFVPTPARLGRAYRVLRTATAIIMPLLEAVRAACLTPFALAHFLFVCL